VWSQGRTGGRTKDVMTCDSLGTKDYVMACRVFADVGGVLYDRLKRVLGVSGFGREVRIWRIATGVSLVRRRRNVGRVPTSSAKRSGLDDSELYRRLPCDYS
jgi:hypothetical protein